MELKNYNKGMSLTVAFLALLVSVISIFISGNANGLSERANEIASKSAEIQHRPWLVVHIKKNIETGNFFDIVKEDSNICWKFSVLIENKGTTPAKKIALPSIVHLKDIGSLDELQSINLNNIILGQGDKYCYDFTLCGETASGQNIDALLKQFKANMAPLKFKVVVTYEGLVSMKNTYKTSVTFEIKQDFVDILEGNFE